MATRRIIVTNRFAVMALCTIAGTTVALENDQSAAAATVPSVTVSYRDLNLARAADAHVLYLRLARAAVAVCPAVPTYELARFAAYQLCVETVLADAVHQVHSSTLKQAASAEAAEVASLHRRELR
jgi:UrcA family protein